MMMKHFGPALRLFLFLTVLTGGAYPILMTALGQVLFPRQANGSLILRDGKVIGSELIAQKFEKDTHFWPRPSAVDFNPLPSGGSNWGPTSQDLKLKVEERRKQGREGELLFASASGLDPHISPGGALAQVSRIASHLGIPERKVIDLIQSQAEGRDFGCLGEPRINVLKLNLALDEQK